MFFYSPRFELPMGASEQPPLPQQSQNQSKVRRILSFLGSFLILQASHSLFLPTVVRLWHGPIIAVSYPANQLQPGQHRHPDDGFSAEQYEHQQRASAFGPGHLLQGESSTLWCIQGPSRPNAFVTSPSSVRSAETGATTPTNALKATWPF